MSPEKSRVYHYHDYFGNPVTISEDKLRAELEPLEKAAGEGYAELEHELKKQHSGVMRDILTGRLPIYGINDDNGQRIRPFFSIQKKIDEISSVYWQKKARFVNTGFRAVPSNFHSDLPQEKDQHLWWGFRRNYKTEEEFYSDMGERISGFYGKPIDAKQFSADVDAVLKEMKFDPVKYGKMMKLRSQCRFEDEVKEGAELLGLDISNVKNLMDIRRYVEVTLDYECEHVAFDVIKHLRKMGYAIPRRKNPEQVQTRKDDKRTGGLENTVTLIISITSLIGAIFLSNNITGNIIGLNNSSTSILGVGLFLVGIIGSFLYLRKRR